MEHNNHGKESSLGKALRLLTAVSECPDPAGISVASLVKVTGFSRPTTYRFLNELQQFGLVRSSPMWQLGPKVVALAAMSGNWAILRRRARQAMEEFTRDIGYSIHLGIRDGNEVVYIDKSESPKYAAVASVIGQRRALHVTAMGKCLIAFDVNADAAQEVAKAGLEPRTAKSIVDSDAWIAAVNKVRAEGIAFDDGECDEGSRCVAAPILDAQGYAVAALSVSALSRPGELDVHSLANEVRRLADEIGASPIPRISST